MKNLLQSALIASAFTAGGAAVASENTDAQEHQSFIETSCFAQGKITETLQESVSKSRTDIAKLYNAYCETTPETLKVDMQRAAQEFDTLETGIKFTTVKESADSKAQYLHDTLPKEMIDEIRFYTEGNTALDPAIIKEAIGQLDASDVMKAELATVFGVLKEEIINNPSTLSITASTTLMASVPNINIASPSIHSGSLSEYIKYILYVLGLMTLAGVVVIGEGTRRAMKAVSTDFSMDFSTLPTDREKKQKETGLKKDKFALPAITLPALPNFPDINVVTNKVRSFMKSSIPSVEFGSMKEKWNKIIEQKQWEKETLAQINAKNSIFFDDVTFSTTDDFNRLKALLEKENIAYKTPGKLMEMLSALKNCDGSEFNKYLVEWKDILKQEEENNIAGRMATINFWKDEGGNKICDEIITALESVLEAKKEESLISDIAKQTYPVFIDLFWKQNRESTKRILIEKYRETLLADEKSEYCYTFIIDLLTKETNIEIQQNILYILFNINVNGQKQEPQGAVRNISPLLQRINSEQQEILKIKAQSVIDLNGRYFIQKLHFKRFLTVFTTEQKEALQRNDAKEIMKNIPATNQRNGTSTETEKINYKKSPTQKIATWRGNKQVLLSILQGLKSREEFLEAYQAIEESNYSNISRQLTEEDLCEISKIQGYISHQEWLEQKEAVAA